MADIENNTALPCRRWRWTSKSPGIVMSRCSKACRSGPFAGPDASNVGD